MPSSSDPTLAAQDNASLFARPEVLALLACPACYEPLELRGMEVACGGCSRRYPIVDGVPVLLVDRALP